MADLVEKILTTISISIFMAVIYGSWVIDIVRRYNEPIPPQGEEGETK